MRCTEVKIDKAFGMIHKFEKKRKRKRRILEAEKMI